MVAISLLIVATAQVGPIRQTADSVRWAEGSGHRRIGVGLIALPHASDRSVTSALAARFAHDTLGLSWPRWIQAAPSRDCEPNRGFSSIQEPVLWVFRCREPWLIGRFETECYLVGADSVPTIERTRWSAGPACGLSRGTTGAFAESLATDLARASLARGRHFQRTWLSDPLVGRWTALVELGTAWGDLRLLRGEDADRDSLILEHTSRRLDDELARSEHEGDTYDPSTVGADTIRLAAERAGTARALRALVPDLARCLEGRTSHPSDAPIVAEALRRIGSDASGGSDAIRWGAHLWGLGLRVPDTDSLTMRRVNQAFTPYHCSLRPVHEEDEWCWSDSLADVLTSRAGANRWTERAFLERMDGGWESSCALCGWDQPTGSDLFRPVIQHGEAFLRNHAGSPVADSVRWMVAEAHETAWSLSHAAPDDEYIDWRRYVVDAPAHRSRALELYATLLRREPPGPRRAAVLRRVRRLALDVDTGFHRYWCLWD